MGYFQMHEVRARARDYGLRQKKQKMQLCDNYELTSNKISHVYLYSIFTIEIATIK